MTSTINQFGQIQYRYEIGDTYAGNFVAMCWDDNSFIVKSKNGYYSLIIANRYEGFWSIKTSRNINDCVSHRNGLSFFTID